MQLLMPEWIAPVAPDPALLHDHTIVLEDDRITAVLPTHEALERHADAPRVELPGHLIVPGFVNAHCHAAMTLLRGLADDLPLEQWLREAIWPAEGRLASPEFVADGTWAACAEMVRGGITCFNDMYLFPEATAKVCQEFGMRAVLGILIFDFPSAYGSGPADYLAKGLALRDRFLDDPLISFALAPHAPYTVSDAPLERVASLSAELQLPIHMHVHETAREIADSVSQRGMRPLDRLDRLGLLGPEFIAVHAVHLNDIEIELLALKGVSVAHCPHSNLKLASGIAPVAGLRARGINVAIGTDGAASNNRLDLLAEARTAGLLAKGSSGDARVWAARDVLEAMTLAGARALGLEERIGSIEPGKQADLVAIDLSGLDTGPVFDPIAQLVWCAGREHVRDVWIAGQPIVRGGRFVSRSLEERIIVCASKQRVWHNRIVNV